MKTHELVILGGGASGLAAAVESARRGVRPLVVEKLDRVGKKILVTGNGRCNLLNIHASPAHYNCPDFVRGTLQAFDAQSDLRFFASMGLLTVTDSEGRVYPRTMSAASVLDVLRFECRKLGVEFLTATPVTDLIHRKDTFLLNGSIRTSALIAACGGKAAPAHGTDGSGFALLRTMGHTCTPLRPALVQIRTQTADIRALKGLRSAAHLTLCTPDGNTTDSKGEILFTDYGISGIAAMELSRNALPGSTLTLDLLPELDGQQTLNMLRARCNADPCRPLEGFLTGICHNRIGQTILRRATQLDLSVPCSHLRDSQIIAIRNALKGMTLTVTGTQGFAQAQVTAGGIPTEEFDSHLHSRKCPGLFACGEILDVDGVCGGYNLTFAWSSGRLAAKSAVEYCQSRGT